MESLLIVKTATCTAIAVDEDDEFRYLCFFYQDFLALGDYLGNIGAFLPDNIKR